jgi:hypothetical protein
MLRGLNAKNWAYLEILSNCAGPRVVLKQTQGLFNKTARLNRYLLTRTVRSGSNGSNPIWDGSNLARRLRILRLGLKIRSNRYLPIRTLGSRSGGSDLLWHDLILTVRFVWQNQPELYWLKYASPRRRATSYFKRYNTIGLSGNVPINHRNRIQQGTSHEGESRDIMPIHFTPQAVILQKYTK